MSRRRKLTRRLSQRDAVKLASTFICSEAMLFERLQSLTQRRTAVYISHRFSTVRRADRILFLEHGELVEAGTHEELIRLDGRYAKLFRMQASAYVGDAESVGFANR